MESNMYMMNQQQYYMPQQMMPMNGGMPMNGNQHMNGHNGMNQYANNYVHQNTYVHQNQNHVVSSPLTNKTSHKMGKIVDKAKPKGRMSSYTYFVQTCREEHRKKHPNENVNFTEFSKKCAERWKQMNDSEKQRFSEMAEHDKQRYDKEMSTYVPPPGMNGSHSKRKKKDPNAPKRPLSAFFLFCHDERPGIKALHPTYSVGEVAKDLGERWGKVTADVKAKYEAKAAQEKTRYEKDMATYKSQK